MTGQHTAGRRAAQPTLGMEHVQVREPSKPPRAPGSWPREQGYHGRRPRGL